VASILAAVAVATVLVVSASASKHAVPTTVGTVTAVPSGDTLVVSVTTKKGKKKVAKRLTAHLLGVRAPGGTSCYASQSAAQLKSLALGKRVTLKGNLATGATASLPGVADVGTTLLQQGAAQVDVWRPAFAQLGAYVPLQQAAEQSASGMWGMCAADVSVSVLGAKSADPNTLVTYTVTVANAGPLAAPSVNVELRPGSYAKLISSVASGTAACESKGWVGYCTVTNLAPGASQTISLVIGPTVVGALSARATASLVSCDDQQCGGAPLQDPNLLNDRAAQPTVVPGGSYGGVGHECDPSYPTVCMPPPPPALDCADIAPIRDFPVNWNVLLPDPDHLDGDHNGIACEGDDY